jgi:hypothetical protein
MSCVHLKELDRLCHDHHLEISRSELVRLVCTECGEHEVCPSNRLPEGEMDDAVDLHSGVASVGPEAAAQVASEGSTERL